MFDQRNSENIIDLNNSKCLKENTTYVFTDVITEKTLIAKFISCYEDSDDSILIQEFRKLAILSGEPEIATVYKLSKANFGEITQSCYVMDYISGLTLSTFLGKSEFYIYEVLFEMLIQIASGLEKAHKHEIYHGDLHNENIIINDNRYVKLIDFNWFNFKERKKNISSDTENFKRISNEFLVKCKPSDSKRLSIIINYCKNISTFYGLKKELESIDNMSFDLSLLDEKSEMILSQIFMHTSDNYNMLKVLNVSEDEIPVEYVLELTEQEKEYIKLEKEHQTKGKVKRLKYNDSRIERIENKLKAKLDHSFHLLKQTNLIDWTMDVSNNGEKFLGPYQLNFQISLTSKFFKWKRTNEVMDIVKKADAHIITLVLK